MKNVIPTPLQSLSFVIQGKTSQVFPAFQYRNYRLYFTGQLVSLIGTWLQQVAQQWLVLQLTNSAFWVGTVAALATLPVLFFGLFGGVIVDRFSTRTILQVTNAAQMVCALILGILTITDTITVWQICVLAFTLGVISSIDMPARQSFAVELVDRKHLSSAIALNAATFNGARVIGPGLAGLIIALFGIGGAFIINGLTFIPVIMALFLMHLQKFVPKVKGNAFKEIKDGIAYALSLPLLRILLVFAGMLAIFGWTYITILPVVAKDVFGLGASGFGFLTMSAGIGALGATVFISTYGRKLPALYIILLGNAVFGMSLVLFSFSPTVYIGVPLLVGTGFGLLSQFATMNTMIQHMVDDHVRGRIMSIYTIMFMGLSPIGSFQIGAIAEEFGSQFALRINAIIVLICGLILFLLRKKILKIYRHHN